MKKAKEWFSQNIVATRKAKKTMRSIIKTILGMISHLKIIEGHFIWIAHLKTMEWISQTHSGNKKATKGMRSIIIQILV